LLCRSARVKLARCSRGASVKLSRGERETSVKLSTCERFDRMAFSRGVPFEVGCLLRKDHCPLLCVVRRENFLLSRYSHRTNRKRDIVDMSTHASCGFGHNPYSRVSFSTMWGVVSKELPFTQQLIIEHLYTPHTLNTIGGF
jgi:hypothetical protein